MLTEKGGIGARFNRMGVALKIASHDWKKIIHEVQRQPSYLWQLTKSGGVLASILSYHLPSIEDPNQAYSRNLLYHDPQSEVILMGWQKELFCAPHDHEHAIGLVYLLSGKFIERHWQFKQGQLQISSVHHHEAPKQISVPLHLIHDMKSLDGGMSLHLYFPRIKRMKVYDMKQQRTLEVSENCGAWVPKDLSMILSETSWE